MTEIYLVRHGEAEHNLKEAGFIGGKSHDARLTTDGEEQARRFGRYLRKAHLQPTQVWTSGAVRTNQTAELSLTAAGIELIWQEDDRFHELSQGGFEGQPRAQVYTDEVSQQLQQDGLDGRLPGGESLADAQHRMENALLELCENQPNGTILIYSHGLAIRALAGKIMDADKATILAMKTPNLSVTTIYVIDGSMHLREIGKNVIEGIH